MKKLFFATIALALFVTACKKKKDDTTPVTPTTTGPVELTGDISADMTLDASKKYLLKGFVFVKSGATLHIPAGTVIMGDKATKGSLIITRGGKIDAVGTADKPIVFTSAQATGARREADWGGIIILGKSTTNATGGEAKIEGGLVPTAGGDEKQYIYYGGTDAADNSGTLKYVRIEFAGIAFSPDNEINGLTLGAVGSGTTISYVQVYRSGDDAFEWFGGTVNCDHLVATYSWDDDWDTDNGFNGKVQFCVSQRVKTIADQSGSNGFESDNDANGSTNNPQTKAMFCNMTIIGPITTNGNSGINANFQNAAQIRRNSSMNLFNSLLIGFPVGVYIDNTKGTKTIENIKNGSLLFKGNIIAGCTIPWKSESSSVTADTAAWNAFKSSTVTTVAVDATVILMGDPNKFSADVSTSVGRPNFLLQAASLANSGAVSVSAYGLQNVTYRGAFDGSNDWTKTWTTWAAEATAY